MQSNLKKIAIMLSIMFILIASITAIMTFANLSASQHFIGAWIHSFIFAFLILLPLGAGIFITLNKLINRALPSWSTLHKNLLQGALMALIMESFMAVITVLSGHSYESINQFSTLFFNSLLYALPVGLSLSLLMTLLIKPKLEKHLFNTAA
ncbi:DUF2798 domain-containing protein [Psychromonas sp. RZ22]|uniref:DUF2798 domain-containing protein n=1 Tax=Psychromonas algarum TaxID=2555643 RepID=UPI0010671D44|nr:DUF2798 domain-containing protein [Psychromonas sp. RZ22]TEW56831.1 DUF2798 domain-containing protein [Psychromonas sp. RZ22]